MLERQLQTRFRNKLFKECQKNNLLGLYYKIPDFPGGTKRPYDAYLLMNGKHIAFEFKSVGKKPTKMQNYFLDLTKKCGGVAYTVTEKNYKTILKGIIRGGIITKKIMNDAGLIKSIVGKESPNPNIKAPKYDRIIEGPSI